MNALLLAASFALAGGACLGTGTTALVLRRRARRRANVLLRAMDGPTAVEAEEAARGSWRYAILHSNSAGCRREVICIGDRALLAYLARPIRSVRPIVLEPGDTLLLVRRDALIEDIVGYAISSPSADGRAVIA